MLKLACNLDMLWKYLFEYTKGKTIVWKLFWYAQRCLASSNELCKFKPHSNIEFCIEIADMGFIYCDIVTYSNVRLSSPMYYLEPKQQISLSTSITEGYRKFLVTLFCRLLIVDGGNTTRDFIAGLSVSNRWLINQSHKSIVSYMYLILV